MTGRIAATFPGAARLAREDDEWEVHRTANRHDIDDGDTYLGSVYREGGVWYAVHAVHTYDTDHGLDYHGVVTAPTPLERNLMNTYPLPRSRALRTAATRRYLIVSVYEGRPRVEASTDDENAAARLITRYRREFICDGIYLIDQAQR